MINFVTGGTGFIGKRLICALRKEQINVRLLSRKKLNKNTIVCDLKVDSIPDDSLIGVDTIFHLAGFSHDMRDATKIQNI